MVDKPFATVNIVETFSINGMKYTGYQVISVIQAVFILLYF